MKTSRIYRIALSGLALATGLPGCGKPLPVTAPTTEETRAEVSFPIEMVIRDNQNRPLDGWIVGKTAENIYVRRKSDNQEFKIPIDQLNPEDKFYAENLPIQVPPSNFKLDGMAPQNTNSGPKNDPYVTSRREQIDRLQADVTALKLELRYESNNITIRTKTRDMENLLMRIGELEGQIVRYQAENQ